MTVRSADASAQRTNKALILRVAIYFLGNICSKLITLLLSRLQTQNLVPAAFGPASLLANTLPQLVSICFFEMWAGTLRYMYDESTFERKHRVFTNALAAAAMLLPLFFVAAFWLNRTQGTAFLAELLVMGILYLLDCLYQFTVRGMGRNRLFAVTGVISSFVLGASQLLFLTVFRLGPVSLILSPICASLVSISIYELKTGILRRCRRSEVEWSFVRMLIRFSFPLSVNATAFVLLTRFNEFYVQRHLGNSALGYLTAANKLAMVVNIFISVFSLAWQETAFSISADENRGAYYSATLRNYMKLLGVGSLMLIAFSRPAFALMIDVRQYAAAYSFVPFSVIAVAVSALSSFMGHIYTAEKRNDQLFYSTVFGAGVNILAMIVLLPVLGLQAANLSLGIGFTATFLYRYFNIQRMTPVRMPWRVLIWSAAGISLNTVIFFYLPQRVPNRICMAASAVAAVFALRQELRVMLAAVRRKLRSGRRSAAS